ncbi:GIY-YIG nuclease family protein [Paraburkholderia flava]|uniref:GIY-YIG nuclease family protein n=1 Tax=Paraburkholderia flava TaxID=2547393 RepID=UPI00106199E4|nr:GIY-YIG nuclease family protein [Paraburkholderia flava]
MSATKGNINLRSASELAEIKSIEHLYKIGFSTTPVDGRIKNARQEPTCLMAPVKIVSVFECYNPQPAEVRGFAPYLLRNGMSRTDGDGFFRQTTYAARVVHRAVGLD